IGGSVFEERTCVVVRWALVAIAVALPLGSPLAKAEAVTPAERQTEQVVVRALQLNPADRGIAVRVLRAPLPATAAVHLVSLRGVPGQRAWVARLACDDSSDCLPFYAFLQGAGLASFPQPGATRSASHAPATQPRVHAGNRVEIVEETSGMRLHTAGVCL